MHNMDNNNLQEQIDELKKEVQRLKDTSIKIGVDPDTYKVLVNLLSKPITDAVQTSISATQVYSTLSPSGVAVSGSIWCKNTGIPSTSEIYVSDGASWIQVK